MIRFSACLKNGYMKMINQQVEDLLRNALDALEYHTEYTRPIHKTTLAIEAIKQALEQPAKQCNDCNGMGIQDGKGDKCLSCDGNGEQTAQTDPCPGCRKCGVCRTPNCGRLKLPVDHPFRSQQPAQQEPVAWKHPVTADVFSTYAMAKKACCVGQEPIPLYTSPQRKPWVGLTDEEVDYIMARNDPHCDEINFARAIEAKLREKNA